MWVFLHSLCYIKDLFAFQKIKIGALKPSYIL